MTVVSVDLASRRYRDIGVAVLRGTPIRLEVELVLPTAYLSGTPDSASLACLCVEIASSSGADLILLDGPQGWRADSSRIEHMRACEKSTRAPGKTGLPGIVKPRSWTRMAEFSIAVFDALDALGWPRLSGGLGRAAVESFPTHSWRALGFPPLPGNPRREQEIKSWMHRLSTAVDVKWPRLPSHDELQALMAGIGGLHLRTYGISGCELHGEPPRIEAGTWREGFILSPRRSTAVQSFCGA